MSTDVFKNKIRIRVNGLLINDDAILLVQLKSPVTDELVWMPPGGGVEFGESMKVALKREFDEETGLEVSVQSLAFVNELVKPPFHAVECYFYVKHTGGNLRQGHDPELGEDEQLIKDLEWINFDDLGNISLVPEHLKNRLLDMSSQDQPPGFYN